MVVKFVKFDGMSWLKFKVSLNHRSFSMLACFNQDIP
ncbi:MAG: hypothetical protein FD155_2870 [Bacteroidetes bacterium]|nr:MAG: hypothetical protein FD155_2870 [Bacteroidota bacterium]